MYTPFHQLMNASGRRKVYDLTCAGAKDGRRSVNAANDELKRKAMWFLDMGMAVTFLWTAYSAWIGYAGPRIVSRSIFQPEKGWSRDTLTLAEETMISQLLLYTLVIHVAIWVAYWIVRRLRKRSPPVSDAGSFVLAAILTVCYLPAFIAGLAFDCMLVGLILPNGLPTLCSHLAYLDAADRPFVYSSVALKVAVMVIPILIYASACLTRATVAHQGQTRT
jgi:hypothetical protein